MKIFIDEELKNCITKEWIEKVLSIVPSKMLEDLIVKVVEPTKFWKKMTEQNLIKNWQSEDTQEELWRRSRLGFSPKTKEVVIEIRKKAWKYYRFRRDVARVLYHEVFHANDPEDLEKTEYGELIPIEEYRNHPREIRARAFEKNMFRHIKGKRKLFSLHTFSSLLKADSKQRLLRFSGKNIRPA